MSEISTSPSKLPPEQEAIRAKCFHPSGTFVEFPIEDVETSIPARFEKMVRLYPNQIAVKSDSDAVTYVELNAMANRLARILLTERGNEPEAIALLLSKGAHLMAAMLGVLKAGKFFILLDSSFPNARNVALLEDSQAGLVIADGANASLARHIITSPIRLMEFESIDLSISIGDLDLRVLPGAFATILYTSGSTGEPKGIICDHQDLLHRAMLRRMENQACEHDRIALLPTGTANAVTNSLFALLNGARLCPFDTQREGVFPLAKWLSGEGITICPFSSSLFRSFAAALTQKETFSTLRILRLRSETVHKSDIDLYKQFFSNHCKLVTGLSTSETGQLTTYLLNDNIDIPDDGVPIGYPVQDKEILLLDDAGNEVGVNQVGEIVVRSRYFAVGYWRRPELTAAKFKADPKQNGQRLCFTGDLGLRLPDGCLVHKGRKDFRVKIRGYGVEPAEVERCLLRHGDIKEAVVVASQTDTGDARLMAYFTAHNHSAPSVGKLRSFLEGKLPHYMMPSGFVLLDAMPLTSNGKIDRSALPRAGNSRPDLGRRPNLEQQYIGPSNKIETRLVRIWEALLDIRPIGIHDNFFELGGHSLTAARIVSRVVESFQLELPLQAFFQSPTISEMAIIIAQNQAKAATDAGLAKMLSEIETMTEEEARKQLSADSVRR